MVTWARVTAAERGGVPLGIYFRDKSDGNHWWITCKEWGEEWRERRNEVMPWILT